MKSTVDRLKRPKLYLSEMQSVKLSRENSSQNWNDSTPSDSSFSRSKSFSENFVAIGKHSSPMTSFSKPIQSTDETKKDALTFHRQHGIQLKGILPHVIDVSFGQLVTASVYFLSAARDSSSYRSSSNSMSERAGVTSSVSNSEREGTEHPSLKKRFSPPIVAWRS